MFLVCLVGPNRMPPLRSGTCPGPTDRSDRLNDLGFLSEKRCERPWVRPSAVLLGTRIRLRQGSPYEQDWNRSAHPQEFGRICRMRWSSLPPANEFHPSNKPNLDFAHGTFARMRSDCCSAAFAFRTAGRSRCFCSLGQEQSRGGPEPHSRQQAVVEISLTGAPKLITGSTRHQLPFSRNVSCRGDFAGYTSTHVTILSLGHQWTLLFCTLSCGTQRSRDDMGLLPSTLRRRLVVSWPWPAIDRRIQSDPLSRRMN